MSKKSEYPECNECGNAMVPSFAFRGCEYVCLPCNTAVPMWNDNRKVQRTIKHIQSKKRLWREELSILGRRYGGGRCAICQDGSCQLCKKTKDQNYQFKIWKSRCLEEQF